MDSRYIIKPVALEEYAVAVEETVPLLEHYNSCESYIADVRKRLYDAVEQRENDLSHAAYALDAAEEELSREKKRVETANMLRDSDTPEETVAQSYYANVDRCRSMAVGAQSDCKIAKEIQEKFDTVSSDTRDIIADAIKDYRETVRKIREYFDTYLEEVDAAKQAMSYSSSRNGNSANGVCKDVFSSCGELSAEQIKTFQKNTGKSEKWIIQNVRMDENGVYFIKTRNYSLEGQTTDTNVLYKREEFMLNGVKCCGVFPQFVKTFELTMPENYYYQNGIGQGKSFYHQSRYCVRQLQEAIEKDERLRSYFSETQLTQIANGMTPSGFTWQHHVPPGRMQLVYSRQHNVAWGVAGGRGHTGGETLWCGLPRISSK